MSDLPELAPGTRVGPYTVDLEIGRGSTATVYLCRPSDPAVGGPSEPPRVALKVRHRGEQRLDKRFLREVESLRPLRIPGVARLHAAGRTEHLLWYAMDMVDGVPLRRWIHDHGRPEQRVAAALSTGARLCDILRAIHRRGLVHQDIKPGNVHVDRDGAVHVLDFGVVGWWSHGGTLTGSGRLVGTMPYMAPEQVASIPLTGAADVFAAGLILYEGILGPRPRPDRPREWLDRQVRERLPSLVVREPAVPRSLSLLVDRMLALDPTDRPEAAEDAVAARIKGEGDAPPVQFLVGPTGSGRGRIAEEVQREALLRGVRFEVGRCSEESPGGAIGTLVRQLVGVPADPARRARLLGDDARTLLEMWPDLPVGQELTPGGGGSSAREVAQAAACMLARATAHAGLLLVLHEVDQVDPLTARVLTELARRAPPRLSIVCTVDDRWATPRARRVMALLAGEGLGRAVTAVDLDADHADALISDLAPGASRRAVGPCSPQRAVESGLAALAASRSERWPALPAPAVPLGIARTALPDAVVAHLGLDVDALLHDGVLRRDRDGRLKLATTTLVGVARSLLDKRAEAEDRLADAIGACWSTSATWAPLAAHRLAGCDPASALVPAIQAALVAAHEQRFSDAREWLMVVDRLPRNVENADYQALRFELSWCRAETSLHTDGARVRADLVGQAISRARSTSQRVRAGLLRAALMAREGRFDIALAECRERAEALAGHDIELASTALLAEAGLHLARFDTDSAMRRLDRTEVLRGGRRTDLLQIRTDLLRADVLCQAGDVLACLDRCRETLPHARAGGYVAMEAALNARLGVALITRGERDSAEDVLWSSAVALRSVGLRAREAEAHLALGRIALGRGDAQAAVVRAEQSIAAARGLGLRRLLPDALALRLDAAANQGDAAAAVRTMDDFRQLGVEHAGFRAAQLRWWRARLDHRQARAARRGVVAVGEGGTQAAIELARAFLEAGDLDGAADALAQATHEARTRGYEDLALLARLIGGAVSPQRDGGWAHALAQAEASSWTELGLTALEMDGRRRLALGDLAGGRAQLERLLMRARALDNDAFSRVALATLEVESCHP